MRPCPTCESPIPCGYQNVGSKYCSEACKPRCSVDGCDQPQRKRTWCASHYAQRQRTGQPPEPFRYKWAERKPCTVCGAPSVDHYREFCSGACRLRREHPRSVTCVACGVAIDLTETGKRGQRKKVNTKLCTRCRQDCNKYHLSVLQLAARDGLACGICGETVDMELRRADSGMCASVDHIIPRALGGTHDAENLQLAHLYCNQVKSDLRGREPRGVVI